MKAIFDTANNRLIINGRHNGFPQAYQYKGLIRYTLASWKEWKANNSAQVRMAKQRFK